MDLNRPWRFDASVAAVYDTHVRQNIPDYEPIIGLSLDIIQASCEKHDRIAEVGCATGFTLNALEAAGFIPVLGIDHSQSSSCLRKLSRRITDATESKAACGLRPGF